MIQESDNDFIEERYPKDLHAHFSDLETINLDTVLNNVKRDEIHFLSFTLSNTAKKEKEKGNLSTAKAL